MSKESNRYGLVVVIKQRRVLLMELTEWVPMINFHFSYQISKIDWYEGDRFSSSFIVRKLEAGRDILKYFRCEIDFL